MTDREIRSIQIDLFEMTESILSLANVEELKAMRTAVASILTDKVVSEIKAEEAGVDPAMALAPHAKRFFERLADVEKWLGVARLAELAD